MKTSCTDNGRFKIETLDIVKRAKAALLAKKGEEVVVMDVHELSTITDYYILATGNTPPHIRALMNEVERVLKETGSKCYHRAGSSDSEWMVADYMDLVVHVFSPATRKYYEFERLWKDAVFIKDE
ncbi:MAG: ribosome silencing factor [Lentisphaerota bacterium]